MPKSVTNVHKSAVKSVCMDIIRDIIADFKQSFQNFQVIIDAVGLDSNAKNLSGQ